MTQSICPECLEYSEIGTENEVCIDVYKCTECEEIYCQSCLEDGICPTCKEEMENENEEQETQITRVNKNENTSKPQTENAEVKLAS